MQLSSSKSTTPLGARYSADVGQIVMHGASSHWLQRITENDLPQHFNRRQLSAGLRSRGPISLRDLELEAIHEALDRHDGAKPKAAAELGISLKTLSNKLNQETGMKAA